jgi:hypothetical protein
VRTLVGFVTGCTLLPSNETLDRRSHGSLLAVRLGLGVFVLCNRHQFNKVPGDCLRIPGTWTLTMAMLPLTLLCAPVNIRKSRAAL